MLVCLCGMLHYFVFLCSMLSVCLNYQDTSSEEEDDTVHVIAENEKVVGE